MYRRLNGLTQEDMAELIDVERTTIVRWEQGAEPAARFRRRIKSVLESESESDVIIRRLIRFVDTTDGLATLLTAELEVIRTSRAHQKLGRYDTADVYGRSSERYWGEAMTGVMERFGGIEGYREAGIVSMDLSLVRHPGEPGFRSERPIASIGRTVAFGRSFNPVCHLTTSRFTEDISHLPPNQVIGVDGPILV
jgi:transcriptional regulator with XRE-family HTH domain